jgi:excisionase family DNA binding protein
MADTSSSFLRGDPVVVPDAAEILHVSKSTVYRWVREGKLKSDKIGRRISVTYDLNGEFFRLQLQKHWSKPAGAFVPKEIKRYGEWHELLDELVWLLKVSYSKPNDIKRKQFRLDQLFLNFLKFHKVTLPKMKRALIASSRTRKRLITDDLKRGWYNELAYALPLKPETLGLSFKDLERNKRSATERFAFPSWRITSAYYSAYFFLRSMVLEKQPNLRLEEHGTTISSFKNNLMGSLSRVIWKFPFSIQSMPSDSPGFMRGIPHLKYAYCSHPRPPMRSPSQLHEHIFRTFRKRGRKNGRSICYTIFDYLHDFRVWANYLEIDNLLNLYGGWYKSFLDQNLSVLLFFIAGMAEVSYISLFGAREYSKTIQHFYSLMVASDTVNENEINYIPQYQRLAVYRSLGFTDLDLLRTVPDRNLVRLV